MLSEKAPLGTQGLVYIGLSVFTVLFFIFTAFAFIFNVILNRPFSLSFLFLNFDLKQKVRPTYSDDLHNSDNTNNVCRRPIGDTLSGGNLKILINALGSNLSSTSNIESNNRDLPTNHNSGQPRIRYNLKKHKSHNLAVKTTKPNSVRSGKSSPKVSTVPNGNKMHGGGDHLS